MLYMHDLMVSRAQIVQALSGCMDPELNANIIEIGLIYNIIVHDNDVKLVLTMTSPMCPVTSIIMADAQLRMETIQGIGKVELELVWEPLWSPEMMSDDLKYRI